MPTGILIQYNSNNVNAYTIIPILLLLLIIIIINTTTNNNNNHNIYILRLSFRDIRSGVWPWQISRECTASRGVQANAASIVRAHRGAQGRDSSALPRSLSPTFSPRWLMYFLLYWIHLRQISQRNIAVPCAILDASRKSKTIEPPWCYSVGQFWLISDASKTVVIMTWYLTTQHISNNTNNKHTYTHKVCIYIWCHMCILRCSIL